MPRVENVPGHSGALPRGLEAALDLPARARQHLADPGPSGGTPSSPRSRLPTVLRCAWTVALVGLSAALAAQQVLDGPHLARQSLAAALGVILAVGLAARSGAHLTLATALALTVAAAAVATQWAPLLAGAAVSTGVIAASLAVLGTRPAASFFTAVLEVVIALLVATAGGLAVAGFAVGIDIERFGYTVLVAAMVTTTVLIYRLGGGLHGLGRRGVILAAGALVLLVVVLVYTAALTRYGSPELVRRVHSAQGWTREHLGGVPHPVEALIGIPALAWGVSLRSRRRQGWWVCAFGTAATATAASRLVDDGLTARGATLSAAYSLALGLLLGLVVIRLERVLTGRGGAHGGQPAAHRGEPSRLQPLH